MLKISDELYNSVFMKACRCERTDYTPIWLMRQAGRYQKSYRDLRAKVSFLELCKTPELAAKVTLDAIEQFGFDASIIFSDILILLEPMGANLEYVGGSKPQIHNPLWEAKDIENLRELESVESLNYVYEAIKLTRRELPANVPLIGFGGAPFTLASYLIEGGGSKNYIHTKRLMYSDKGGWDELMSKISRALVQHLNAQIEAGAQVVQIFDSWVGCLSPEDYREFVLPHTKFVVESLVSRVESQESKTKTEDSGLPTPNSGLKVPIIHFGTGTSTFLEMMRDCGDVIGADWHINLNEAWQKIGYDKAIMGNLDPVKLFAPQGFLLNDAKKILDSAEGRNGHIFNLGHGILPETPVENVKALVDFVKEKSAR